LRSGEKRDKDRKLSIVQRGTLGQNGNSQKAGI